MRLAFQIAFVLLIGAGAVYAGISNFISPENVLLQFYGVDISVFESRVREAIETQIRLLSGMWVAAGLVVLLSARKFESHTYALRLVFLGLSLSSLGELFSVLMAGGDLIPALPKAFIQVGICGGMELWRSYVVREKTPSGIAA